MAVVAARSPGRELYEQLEYVNSGGGECFVASQETADLPACSAVVCSGLMAAALPVGWLKTLGDIFGEVRCVARPPRGKKCACKAAAATRSLKDQVSATSYVFHGDSTTRNMQEPFADMAILAASGARGEKYWLDQVVKASRRALAAARLGNRAALAQMYPGDSQVATHLRQRDTGRNKELEALVKAAKERVVERPWEDPTSTLYHNGPNPRLSILRSLRASNAYDDATYKGLRYARIDSFNHESVQGFPVWDGEEDVRRAWVVNYGLHAFHAWPSRDLEPEDANYVGDLIDTFHKILRDALKRGVLESTILVWRHTSFVCRKNLRGRWNAALLSLEAEPRLAVAPIARDCIEARRANFSSVTPKKWGMLGVEDFCVNGTMDAYGTRWLNGVASRVVTRLNACYLAGESKDGFPCPSDVRGLAARFPKWRLPGVRILRGDAISEAFCGAVDGDGLHAPQSWVLLARCLHALAAPGRDSSP